MIFPPPSPTPQLLQSLRKSQPLPRRRPPLLPTLRPNPGNNPAAEIAEDAGVADAVTLKPRLRTHPLPTKRSPLRLRPKLQHQNPKNPC